MATRSRKGYWRMSQNDLSLVILRPQFWNPTAEFMASPPEPVFHREGLGGGFGLCVVGIRPIVIDMTDPAAKGIGQNARATGGPGILPATKRAHSFAG